MPKLQTHNCLICNNIIKTKHKKQKYCSRLCMGIAYQKPEYTFTCKNCHKVKCIPHSQWKQIYKKREIKYCSLICLNNTHIGKKRSLETKKLLKLAWTKRKEKKLFSKKVPNYNKNACKIFEEINKEMNWNGQHAEKNGEFFIKELGYWVDYYEPKLNIVIEYDEKYHSRQKLFDLTRQTKIQNLLQCKFFRIPENKDWRHIIHA